MNETNNQQSNTDTDKHPKNNFDWLKEYQWQKGQSGNPNGRPKEKTLKEFARQFLAGMSDEARLKYLKGVSPSTIWEMAEGKAKQDLELSGEVKSKIIKLNE